MSKIIQGFSLVEFLAASVITTVAAGSIMYGVANIRKTTDLMNIKEKAFEQLTGYTDFWKGKIAAGEYGADNSSWVSSGQFPLVRKEERDITATLFRKGYQINQGSPYPLYSLETKIVPMTDCSASMLFGNSSKLFLIILKPLLIIG